jgi:hypothetical protein
MRWIACLALFGLLGAGCQAQLVASYPNLEKDRTTRVNLRPDGLKLTSANYIALPNVIPAGSPARVTKYSNLSVEMLVNGVPYVMYPFGVNFSNEESRIDAFLKKYFVDTPNDLKLDAIAPGDMKATVLAGQHRSSMTKEQVYTSLGPPAYIDDTIPAVNIDYEKIMSSDNWWYPTIWALFPWYNKFIFGGGKLQQVL